MLNQAKLQELKFASHHFSLQLFSDNWPFYKNSHVETWLSLLRISLLLVITSKAVNKKSHWGMDKPYSDQVFANHSKYFWGPVH